MLDQVRIYNRALNSEEITLLLNELPPAPPSPFATWLANFNPTLGDNDALPMADPNQNGITNLMEYALDFHAPNDASMPLPTSHFMDDGNDRWMVFTWRKNNWASDLTYSVEYSHDLSTWLPLQLDGIQVVETLLDNDIDGDASASLLETRAKIDSKSDLFMRLKINANE